MSIPHMTLLVKPPQGAPLLDYMTISCAILLVLHYVFFHTLARLGVVIW